MAHRADKIPASAIEIPQKDAKFTINSSSPEEDSRPFTGIVVEV
jgi:hypothetical protein